MLRRSRRWFGDTPTQAGPALVATPVQAAFQVQHSRYRRFRILFFSRFSPVLIAAACVNIAFVPFRLVTYSQVDEALDALANVDNSAVVDRQQLDHLNSLDSRSQLVTLLGWALLIGLLALLTAWRSDLTKPLRSRRCANTKQLLRHWTMQVWTGLFLATTAIALIYQTTTTSDPAHAITQYQSTLHVLEARSVAVAVTHGFLIAAVILTDRRVSQYLAQPAEPTLSTPLPTAPLATVPLTTEPQATVPQSSPIPDVQ